MAMASRDWGCHPACGPKHRPEQTVESSRGRGCLSVPYSWLPSLGDPVGHMTHPGQRRGTVHSPLDSSSEGRL